MTLQGLCAFWRSSEAELESKPDMTRALRLVRQRALCLDEMELRQPGAFAQWLTTDAPDHRSAQLLGAFRTTTVQRGRLTSAAPAASAAGPAGGRESALPRVRLACDFRPCWPGEVLPRLDAKHADETMSSDECDGSQPGLTSRGRRTRGERALDVRSG